MPNENRVTEAQIKALLDNAETEEYTFFGKDHIVCYKLSNGFTVSGRGACVDPKNFDIEVGRSVARKNAEQQLWQLEGYLLQDKLFAAGLIQG